MASPKVLRGKEGPFLFLLPFLLGLLLRLSLVREGLPFWVEGPAFPDPEVPGV